MKRLFAFVALFALVASIGCGESTSTSESKENKTAESGKKSDNEESKNATKSSGTPVQNVSSKQTTGAGNEPVDQVTELVGEIMVDGSSTVAPITTKAKDHFNKKYPNVKVAIGISGTGGGFKRFVKGETHISDASRPIKQSELEACRKNGVKFIEIPVAYDGLTIAIHKENTWASKMTVDQIKKMFNKSGAAENWSDIDSSWPEEKIKFYIPGKDSGTFDYFNEVVAGKTDEIREDVTPSEDDHQLVAGIAGDKYAIGFFGVSYYEANKDKVSAVSIVNPKTDKAEFPTPESIETGAYAPFSRPLFIYVAEEKAGAAHVKRFVEFYLNNGAQIAQESQYVGLPAPIYKMALLHFRTKTTGTHYLTSEGEKRHGSLPELYERENCVD